MVLDKNIQQFMPSLALLKAFEKTLDYGNIGCGIFFFFYLKKTFDTVEHDILLPKFKHCGVHGLANE